MLRNSVSKVDVVVLENALTLLDRRIGGAFVVEDLVEVFAEDDDDWLLLLFPLREEDLKAETAISRENEGKCGRIMIINVFVGNGL